MFFPEDAANGEAMLHKADKALYKAKDPGKNQIFFHQTESQ